jgi:type I restriction enzyme S subunit
MRVLTPTSDAGLRVPLANYKPEGALAIVDQGEGLIGGYTDDLTVKVNAPKPLIVFGDHTRRLKFVDLEFAVGAQGVKLLRPAAVCNPRYLFHALNAFPVESRGYSRHFELLRKVMLPIPPLAEQARIVGRIEELDSVIHTTDDTVAAQLRRLTRLRQSILKWAFEGKLVDQDPNDEAASVLLERIKAERAAAAPVAKSRANRVRTKVPR